MSYDDGYDSVEYDESEEYNDDEEFGNSSVYTEELSDNMTFDDINEMLSNNDARLKFVMGKTSSLLLVIQIQTSEKEKQDMIDAYIEKHRDKLSKNTKKKISRERVWKHIKPKDNEPIKIMILTSKHGEHLIKQFNS